MVSDVAVSDVVDGAAGFESVDFVNCAELLKLNGEGLSVAVAVAVVVVAGVAVDDDGTFAPNANAGE